MERLGKDLAKMAKKKGICKEWHDRLAGLKDKDAMIDMYVRGIDFCLSNDYPSNDFIRTHFKGSMEAKGVYLDDVVDVRNARHCVLLGGCSGRVAVDGFNVSNVYLKNDTAVLLEVSCDAFVVVDLFDNARLDVCVSGRAKVCVNRYGGWIGQRVAAGDAVVKVIEKNRPTY